MCGVRRFCVCDPRCTPSTRPEDVIPAQLNAVEKQRVRKWYALEADAGGEHKSSNVHGELELILEWCYNPELDFDPFARSRRPKIRPVSCATP